MQLANTSKPDATGAIRIQRCQSASAFGPPARASRFQKFRRSWRSNPWHRYELCRLVSEKQGQWEKGDALGHATLTMFVRCLCGDGEGAGVRGSGSNPFAQRWTFHCVAVAPAARRPSLTPQMTNVQSQRVTAGSRLPAFSSFRHQYFAHTLQSDAGCKVHAKVARATRSIDMWEVFWAVSPPVPWP